MATFNLNTGLDNISGGNSNDTFIATYNNGMTGTFTIGDTLNGNAGIDTLNITPIGVAAIAPPDTLWNNIFNIEKIVINPTFDGAQTITTGAAFQAAFAGAGINLKTTSGAGAITTDMSSFTGAIALTTISDAGAQTLTMGAGLATVLATSTAGAQTITTGTGLATVIATTTAGAQTIAGANLTSVKITSTGGGQTITSTGAASVTVEATSTAGVQTITTGAGADVITATTTAATNIITAGAGNDTVTVLASATGNYTIHGNEDNDTIIGGTGNDTIYGDIGNDSLLGFNPNSVSLGRGQIDNLNGGAGSDRFILGDSNWIGYDDGSNTSSGVADYANIADFNSSEGDVIQLRGSSSDYLLTAVGADTQILINKLVAEPDELIGVIRNQTGLSLTGAYFDYKLPPVLAIFAIASAAATEGSAITFTVTRTGNTQSAQAVTVTTSIGINNTASVTDFTAKTGTLSFTSGETTKTFTVQTIQDNLVEANETFAVSLTNPTNGAILSATNSTAIGTINNDDFGLQQITSLATLNTKQGQTIDIPLFYNTSTADNTLSGIGLRLHYNSASLSYQNVTNLFTNNLIGSVIDNADTQNFDGNTSTDRFVQLQYNDLAGNWPNQTLPLKLGDFNFTAQSGFTGTSLNVTAIDGTLATNYSLQSSPLVVSKQAWNLDIDGDGTIGALSDGVILMRYLLGGSVFSGDALINGASSSNATRNATQIRAYIQQGVSQKDLDIDGNGYVTALFDGLIAQRYLFGATFSGNALINGAIAPDATRDLAGIQSYMAGLTNLT